MQQLMFPFHFGLNHGDVTLHVSYNQDTGYSMWASLSVLITTLCPCSKEISEYSAHNQRGMVSMKISLTDNFDENSTDWKKCCLKQLKVTQVHDFILC